MCVPTPLSCPTPLLWIHFVSVRASILFYSHRNHPIMESTLPAYQFYANLLTKYSSTIKGTRGGKLKAKQPHHWLFDCRELTGKRFSWRTGQLHKAARTVHTTSFQNVNCNWKENVCKFLWPRLFCDAGPFFFVALAHVLWLWPNFVMRLWIIGKGSCLWGNAKVRLPDSGREMHSWQTEGRMTRIKNWESISWWCGWRWGWWSTYNRSVSVRTHVAKKPYFASGLSAKVKKRGMRSFKL